ncbi:MAG TPA: hypothetical protein VFI24_02310 [Pyrinomonadaceae bacterium]|nr:hypothetical protein [Pyrinomonadaceae bacterium]
MSSERLNKIIEEVKALTPADRLILLKHLEQYQHSTTTSKTSVRRAGSLKGTRDKMAPDFDAPQDENRKYERILDQVGDPTFEFLEDVAKDS